MAGTLVCFHAHPDDEAIQTGGSIARAASEGHRVVLVFATRGELGEVDDGVLAPDETLGDRRSRECVAAAEILGAARVAFLGYHDSGMAGDAANDDPAAFWRADVDEAAARLAALLREESAEVLTVYDDHGGYHHPDHIQVHRVGVRAAALAGTPRVYEATVDREHFIEALRASAALADEHGVEIPGDLPDPEEWADHFTPSALITTRVDVSDRLDQKRAALRAHGSQIGETSFFLSMPDEVFALAFGTEWFIRRNAPEGTRETWLFD
ncbi:MAG: GlcNAc-PI de-N-acetylase [Actinobacteria bacterium]|nr:GlcNAc-PI de-N-acetylase [Actinomycetota bacterium]